MVADLNNGLQLSAFVAHPDLTKAEVDNEQVAVFNIDLTANPARYEINGKVLIRPISAG
ncbi:MAG: hypothetical protein R3D62_07070 [Xanthobacteraceae bacterium]